MGERGGKGRGGGQLPLWVKAGDGAAWTGESDGLLYHCCCTPRYATHECSSCLIKGQSARPRAWLRASEPRNEGKEGGRSVPFLSGLVQRFMNCQDRVEGQALLHTEQLSERALPRPSREGEGGKRTALPS